MLRLLVLSFACALAACGSGEPPPSPAAPVERATQQSTVAAPDTPARPMMVVFARDYCTPCRVMEPWVHELAEEHPAVNIVEVNVDREAHQHLGRFFQITSVPALVFLDVEGHVQRRSSGLASKAQMLAALRSLGWVE